MNITEIKAVFKENNVPLSSDDAWQVQGTWVIKHKALERLAAVFKIVWDKPQVIRAERDEAVILVSATRPDKDISEWSFGEAAINQQGGFGNYNVKPGGKMAAYPWAMAEKRAKDRVIIKLAGLHGAYSEEEADEFAHRNADGGTNVDVRYPEDAPAREPKPEPEVKAAATRRGPAKATPAKVETPVEETTPETAIDTASEPAPETPSEEASITPEATETTAPPAEVTDITAEGFVPKNAEQARKLIEHWIDKAATIKYVTNVMTDSETVRMIKKMPQGWEDEVRDYGKKRLLALGWPPAKNAQKREPVRA